MIIQEYSNGYVEQVIDLILGIQQKELHVQITAADQPDLRSIKEFYQKGNGNFWIAVDDRHVVGTIALIDIGDSEVALRKMFVHPDYRGKFNATAQGLMDKVFEWSTNRQLKNIYLGTIDIMKAAHRFYEKNGFIVIDRDRLPLSFPVMQVDNIFYRFSFSG
jgi:N-acetylglutamate synthase-like GNAT family acetyltransferase